MLKSESVQFWTGIPKVYIKAAIGAVVASIGCGALANVNNPVCGSGSIFQVDFCEQLTGGQSSNPIAGGEQPGNPAYDPIEPIQPDTWPKPVTIPGTKPADDNSQYPSNGVYPISIDKPTRVPRGCTMRAIEGRCGGNAVCLQEAQSICDELLP